MGHIARRHGMLAVAAATAAGVLAVGCGSSSDDGGGSATIAGPGAGRVAKVTFRGPFLANGADAPYYYAQKLGYYKAAGLDVVIRDSKGSAQTIADVAQGGSDFGEVAATNLMLAVAQGRPVQTVATTLGKSSFGFFVPKDSGVTAISGLKGKTVAVTAPIDPIMNAALASAKLSKADVKPVFADSAALIPAYLGGKVQSMYTTALLQGAVQRRASDVLLQSDVGFNPPDYVLVVKQGMLASRPDVVRGFVAATLRGFEAARQDPQAAIDALLAKHPELAEPQAMGTLKAALAFYCSSAQAGKPYGRNAEADWTHAAQTLKALIGLKGGVDAGRFMTNELFDGSKGVDAGSC